MGNTNTTEQKLPLKKKLLFNFLILLFSVFLLIMVELLLRAFSYGRDLHLIIEDQNKDYNEYYSINPFIGEKYFTKFEPTASTNDIFFKNKPQNSYRIFVMGSSSLVGFPYEKNLMATRILQKRLEDAYPDKEIEIINTAITAINSITLNDYIKEIVKYAPDAILIYAGHNEFYGAFGVGSNETMSQSRTIQKLHFTMMHWRLYQLIRNSYTKVRTNLSKGPNADESKGSLMKRIVADPEIVYNSKKYKAGIEQFRINMSEILSIASSNDIPVFISDLVSNVKDIKPLGCNNQSSGSNNALNAYNLAVSKLKSNDTLGAKALFYEAKDLDPVRFRASEDINALILQLATQYKCYFIPTKKLFTEASKDGIIGDNLITEHVHPNINGQFLLAESFYNAIVDSKLIAQNTNPYTIRTSDYYRRNWGYTELDSLIGEFRVKQLKSYWPFVPLTNKNFFRDSFKPKSLIDSMAFSVLNTVRPDVEKMHGFIANIYSNQGNYPLELKEYESLINMNPYWSNYYIWAVSCLQKLKDINTAEKYLNKSLKYRKNYMTYSVLAEIQMTKQNYSLAIENYEQALKLKETLSQEKDLLKKLFIAYHYNKEYDNKAVIEKKLTELGVTVNKKIPKPSFTYSNYIPYNIKDLIKRADEKKKLLDYDSAIDCLKESIRINDTPLANRLIGDIMLIKRDKGLLFYYTKAYDAYKQEPEFLNNYCLAYILNSNFSQANEMLNSLKKLDPSFSEIENIEKRLKEKN